jgi:phage-related protein
MSNKVIAEKAVTTSLQKEEHQYYYPIVLDPTSGTFKMTNNGSAAAPCRITVIPKNDLMLLTIRGLSKEDIKVEKIKAGEILVIDGINREVTIDGKDAFASYDAWEFPRLAPGTSEVFFTNADTLTLSIEYQPRYI